MVNLYYDLNKRDTVSPASSTQLAFIYGEISRQVAGAGLRFKRIPSRNINIGIDGALGKNDWGIYFRIGEAFTK